MQGFFCKKSVFRASFGAPNKIKTTIVNAKSMHCYTWLYQVAIDKI